MLSYCNCFLIALVSLGSSIIEDNPASLLITVPDNDKSRNGEDVEYGAIKGENKRHRKKAFLCISMPIFFIWTVESLLLLELT